MEIAVFWLLASVAVTSAVLVVGMRRAVYSALALIVCLASLAGLYFQLGAEFISAIQVIVYAGAIMVLFLFVIMLLDPESERFQPNRLAGVSRVALPLATLFGFFLLEALPASVAAGLTWGRLSGDTASIARPLFSEFLVPFEVTSVLILAAVVGAVILTRKGES